MYRWTRGLDAGWGAELSVIGYCTNVHAGRDLAETKANLDRFAVRVRERFRPAGPMPVGLWLSARTARDLVAASGETARFRDWLAERELQPFTFNGFPFGDFHSPVVKHVVYEPDWADPARVAYTKDLVAILVELIADDEPEGSISTLPIGWGRVATDEERLRQAARNLIHMAEHLRSVEQETGRTVHLDLEPEPGCLLDRAADVVAFFETRLTGPGGLDVRRYLRVCHDVCHAAVMFEDQAAVLAAYDAAGIRVGKVQLSSAVRVDFDAADEMERGPALAELSGFHEPRYLHQTVIRRGGETRFFEDLRPALESGEARRPAGEWRVHFHVPVFAAELGRIGTTQTEIRQALSLFASRPDIRHFEVETYAWEVLPAKLRASDLATGIAQELRWVHEQTTTVRA